MGQRLGLSLRLDASCTFLDLASHEQKASQTVHIFFLSKDRCPRDYDLVVVLCHFAMFADIFEDDEQGDISTELFCTN